MENKQIGKYKILHLIGEGGMASVYKAEHIKLGNKVAVKILDEALVKKGSIKERFENEAKIMASLEHSNIVRVIDYEETDTSLAIVMELIQGDSLTEYIKQKGALQPREAIRIQKILLETFAYAHHNSIVHRDVKPSNIIIETDKNNNPKILDFGIAKLLQSDANLTSTGMQMGTPLYMSPEQVKDSKDIDHRSDIYSLGVVFYYMLSGKPPYNSSTISNFDIFSKIVHEPMPELEKYPKLNQIIQKATSKELKNRHQTCEEFFVNLENYQNIEPREKQENIKNEDETIIDTSNIDNDETIIEQETEQEFWNSLQNKSDIQLYQQYLQKYPQGKFIKLANKQIKTSTNQTIHSQNKKTDKKNKTKLLITLFVTVVIGIVSLFIWQPWHTVKIEENSSNDIIENTTIKETDNIEENIKNNSVPGKYPFTSTRYLTSSDLRNMSNWELKIMRNEIFARHGFVFKTNSMKNHFNNQTWYKRIPKLNTNDNAISKLTQLEKKNIKLIKSYE